LKAAYGRVGGSLGVREEKNSAGGMAHEHGTATSVLVRSEVFGEYVGQVTFGGDVANAGDVVSAISCNQLSRGRSWQSGRHRR
jgi:hypothetical protein